MEIKEAIDMLEEYQTYWQEIYDEAQSDLEFAKGGGQWSKEDKDAREGRPCIEVNVLPQFIHQVTNQIRQNTPSINVLPASRDTSKEAAEIYKGLIRYIEYRSGADEAYDTAAEYSVTSSIGFICVDHDYTKEDSFEQELSIKRVHNPLSWWIDPNSVECDGSDAEGAIGLSQISKKEFERKYPDKKFISFEKNAKENHKREEITLGHVYRKTYEGKKKVLLESGEVADYFEGMAGKPREIKQVVIRRYTFSGDDMLEESIFPGKYIPVVPVYGKELWIDGQRNLISLIRNAKDPQRRYNYWASIEAEILSKAPIAPFIAEAGSIENFAEEWENPHGSMVLRYEGRDAEGNQTASPIRNQPAFPSAGVLNAMQGAYEDIKRSMGLYDASVGNKSNETSGIAIRSRQQQGDTATFHFPDNLNRSIAQVGRILASAIRYIYDTARIIQIIGDEDEPRMVGVNGAELMQSQEEPVDLTQGEYDIRVVTGQSYATKRQEAAQFYSEIIKADPSIMGKAGDLFVKNIDMAGAEQLANRLKKTIPPELLEGEDGEEMTAKEVALQQQMEQMEQQIQQMGEALKNADAKLMDKRHDAIKLQMEGEHNQAEIELKRDELEQEAQYERMKIENERMKIEADREKIALEREKFLAELAARQAPQPELAMGGQYSA